MTKKSNLIFILLHVIAAWFFIYSFRILSSLFNLSKIEYLQNLAQNETNKLDFKELTYLMYFKVIAGGVGLITSFIISILIVRKQNIWWFNSIIIFIVSSLLLAFGGWNYLKYVFLIPGEIFNGRLALEYLTNGIVMLSLGVTIFGLSIYLNKKLPN